MFRIFSLSSRINELESDNECLRRIQYEVLTTNSILTGNISNLKAEVQHFLTEVIDLKAEVERYRKEAELNDDRVLQTQIECDTLLELNEALRAENADLLDDNTGLLDYNARLLDDNTSLIGDNTNLLEDNNRLLNALREAREKLAQQANTVVQPAPAEEPEAARPKEKLAQQANTVGDLNA